MKGAYPQHGGETKGKSKHMAAYRKGETMGSIQWNGKSTNQVSGNTGPAGSVSNRSSKKGYSKGGGRY